MNTSIGLQSANNVNRFQYKTPNLSDRLKSEQLHEEMVKVRKHFTLKFNITSRHYISSLHLFSRLNHSIQDNIVVA